MLQALLFESRVERDFLDWIDTPDGRRVELEVVRRARHLARAGQKHYGIAALFESIRYDWTLGRLGNEEFRLNNNWRSHLARRVMQRHQDLEGFFELRGLRGRP